MCYLILGYDLIEWLMDRLSIEDSRKLFENDYWNSENSG